MVTTETTSLSLRPLDSLQHESVFEMPLVSQKERPLSKSTSKLSTKKVTRSPSSQSAARRRPPARTTPRKKRAPITPATSPSHSNRSIHAPWDSLPKILSMPQLNVKVLDQTLNEMTETIRLAPETSVDAVVQSLVTLGQCLLTHMDHAFMTACWDTFLTCIEMSQERRFRLPPGLLGPLFDALSDVLLSSVAIQSRLVAIIHDLLSGSVERKSWLRHERICTIALDKFLDSLEQARDFEVQYEMLRLIYRTLPMKQESTLWSCSDHHRPLLQRLLEQCPTSVLFEKNARTLLNEWNILYGRIAAFCLVRVVEDALEHSVACPWLALNESTLSTWLVSPRGGGAEWNENEFLEISFNQISQTHLNKNQLQVECINGKTFLFELKITDSSIEQERLERIVSQKLQKKSKCSIPFTSLPLQKETSPPTVMASPVPIAGNNVPNEVSNVPIASVNNTDKVMQFLYSLPEVSSPIETKGTTPRASQLNNKEVGINHFNNAVDQSVLTHLTEPTTASTSRSSKRLRFTSSPPPFTTESPSEKRLKLNSNASESVKPRLLFPPPKLVSKVQLPNIPKEMTTSMNEKDYFNELLPIYQVLAQCHASCLSENYKKQWKRMQQLLDQFHELCYLHCQSLMNSHAILSIQLLKENKESHILKQVKQSRWDPSEGLNAVKQLFLEKSVFTFPLEPPELPLTNQGNLRSALQCFSNILCRGAA